jgi:hypothetical protein
MSHSRVTNAMVFAMLVGLCVAGRVVSHEANATPVAAASLLAGYFFARRRTALAVPIGAMLISDAVVGGYEWRVRLVVYAALLLPALFGRMMQSRLTVGRVLGASLAGSCAFFLSTNLAHWLFFGGYPGTAAGLIECYAAALPFFRNTLAGDLGWSAALFGCYAIVSIVIRRRDPSARWRFAF